MGLICPSRTEQNFNWEKRAIELIKSCENGGGCFLKNWGDEQNSLNLLLEEYQRLENLSFPIYTNYKKEMLWIEIFEHWLKDEQINLQVLIDKRTIRTYMTRCWKQFDNAEYLVWFENPNLTNIRKMDADPEFDAMMQEALLIRACGGELQPKFCEEKGEKWECTEDACHSKEIKVGTEIYSIIEFKINLKTLEKIGAAFWAESGWGQIIPLKERGWKKSRNKFYPCLKEKCCDFLNKGDILISFEDKEFGCVGELTHQAFDIKSIVNNFAGGILREGKLKIYRPLSGTANLLLGESKFRF